MFQRQCDMITFMKFRHSDLQGLPTLKFVTKDKEKKGHNDEKLQRNGARVCPPLQRPSTPFTWRTSDRLRMAPCDSHRIHRCMWWLPSLFQLNHCQALFSPTAMRPEPIMCSFSRLGPPPEGVHTRSENKPSFQRSACCVKRGVLTIRRKKMEESEGCSHNTCVHAVKERERERKRWISTVFVGVMECRYAGLTIGNKALCGTPIVLGRRSDGRSCHTYLRITPPT